MDGFIGEIRAFPFTYAPRQWLLCNGNSYDYNSSDELWYLYSIIGTKFGGTRNTSFFNVPDLQGRVVIGAGKSPSGTNYNPGDTGGETDIILLNNQMPSHSHTAYGLVTTDTASAPLKEVSVPNSSCYLSNVYEVPPPTVKRQGNFYSSSIAPVMLNSHTLSPFQANPGPHSNMQPYMPMTWCICLDGEWPPRPGQPERPVNPNSK